ncbi:MAG TPA: hypothetical protein VHY32_04285 [Caulobacteraceae bacterium]|jgi:hypothetical protein|nr:hypothetical protein [Caulobacteraceae bacterium]
MTVRLTNEGLISLEGVVLVEDAEPLLQLLLTHPAAAIDWRACDHAHAAIIQILMASGIAPIGPPSGVFMRTVVEPALERYRERAFPKGA